MSEGRPDRTPELKTLEVAKDHKPFDVFVLCVGSIGLVGRKTEARIEPTPDALRHKGCLVEPSMMLGRLIRMRSDGDHYLVDYEPLSSQLIAALYAAADESCELLFPLSRRIAGRERAQPPEYWDARAKDFDRLDADESVLRQVVCDALAEDIAPEAVVYDPACSSGAFLAHLKGRFPSIHTVGQDRSAAMLDIARARVDEVYQGDSIISACRPGRADVVVCRHLNLDVVTSPEAKRLFVSAARSLRKGGIMVVVGHTPVLLRGEWMRRRGFTSLASCGFTPRRHAVLQLYVLRREAEPRPEEHT